MVSLDSLTTKMAKDKGYSGESPTKEGLRGFVCPRANAYGGREGIIPPAVAAEHGLVPRGMRLISVGDTAKAANAARDDGKTEADRYREYYGARLEAVSREQQALQAAREAAEAAARVDDVARRRAEQPDQSAQEGQEAVGSVQSVNQKTSRSVQGVQTRKSPKSAKSQKQVRAAAPSPKGKGGSTRRSTVSEKAPGMFSRPDAPPGPDDTLEGFYEGLAGVGFGTAETSDWAAKPRVLAGLDLAEKPAETVVAELERRGEGVALTRQTVVHKESAADIALRLLSDQVDVLKAENERLHQQVLAREAASPRGLDAGMAADITGYKEIVRQQSEQLARLRQENSDLRSAAEELERRLKEQTPQPSETIRVILSVEERKIKIGGSHWECNIMGALHFSRTGNSVILTVSDPVYASELLAEIQNGPVVILTEDGRTSCAYCGNCDKIYGDADSADFISVFRFTCDLE